MFAALAKFVVTPLAGVFVTGVALQSLLYGGANAYEMTVVFPDAANLVRGGRVQIDGLTAGTIEGLRVEDGKAAGAHLHPGRARPAARRNQGPYRLPGPPGRAEPRPSAGPESNPELPDGAILEGGIGRIDFDQFLRTFDPATQNRIRKAVPNLGSVFGGREEKVGETLETLPPATEAVAQLLAAVGEDGPALRQLLTSLRDLSSRLVDRRNDIAGVVDGLEKFMTAGARRDEALASGLDALPPRCSPPPGRSTGCRVRPPRPCRSCRTSGRWPTSSGPWLRSSRRSWPSLRPTLAAFRPALPLWPACST